jgi:hypothetical protein
MSTLRVACCDIDRISREHAGLGRRQFFAIFKYASLGNPSQDYLLSPRLKNFFAFLHRQLNTNPNAEQLTQKSFATLITLNQKSQFATRNSPYFQPSNLIFSRC